MLLVPALAFMATLWAFGRSAFKGVTKWLLWVLAALCVCAGVVALLKTERRFMAYLLRNWAQVHFYSMNQSVLTLEICKRLGL